MGRQGLPQKQMSEDHQDSRHALLELCLRVWAVAGEVSEEEMFHLLQLSTSPTSQRRSLHLPLWLPERGFVTAPRG